MDETTTIVDPDSSIATPSLRVVEAVARSEGIDPMALEPPLYDTIDPEALDRLFTTTADDSSRARVSFRYRGHDVTVRSDGTVQVA